MQLKFAGFLVEIARASNVPPSREDYLILRRTFGSLCLDELGGVQVKGT